MASARNVMPAEGKRMREALYQGGQMPNSARKLQVFEDMLKQVPGIEWYNIKKHQNWCSLQEKALRAQASKSSEVGYFKMDAEVVAAVVDKMKECPDPPLSVLIAWAKELKVPSGYVCEIAACTAGYQY